MLTYVRPLIKTQRQHRSMSQFQRTHPELCGAQLISRIILHSVLVIPHCIPNEQGQKKKPRLQFISPKHLANLNNELQGNVTVCIPIRRL